MILKLSSLEDVRRSGIDLSRPFYSALLSLIRERATDAKGNEILDEW